MDYLNTLMTSTEYESVSSSVNKFNNDLTASIGRKTSNELDKDDFLKILITQLANQDPLEPMQDKEFIAQMAQFSSLEQMKNMSSGLERLAQDFSQMTSIIESSSATDLLGKQVTVRSGDREITGIVEEVAGKLNPQLKIDNYYYSYSEVYKVKE